MDITVAQLQQLKDLPKEHFARVALLELLESYDYLYRDNIGPSPEWVRILRGAVK
jgi:hypothetical protein